MKHHLVRSLRAGTPPTQCNLDMHLGGDEHVGALDISVDNRWRQAVQVVQPCSMRAHRRRTTQSGTVARHPIRGRPCASLRGPRAMSRAIWRRKGVGSSMLVSRRMPISEPRAMYSVTMMRGFSSVAPMKPTMHCEEGATAGHQDMKPRTSRREPSTNRPRQSLNQLANVLTPCGAWRDSRDADGPGV